jgi:hypothetical protein
MGRRISVVFSSVREDGCLEIRFVQARSKKTFVVDDKGSRTVEPTSEDTGYLEWAEWRENKRKMQMSEVSPLAHGNRLRTVMRMEIVKSPDG